MGAWTKVEKHVREDEGSLHGAAASRGTIGRSWWGKEGGGPTWCEDDGTLIKWGLRRHRDRCTSRHQGRCTSRGNRSRGGGATSGAVGGGRAAVVDWAGRGSHANVRRRIWSVLVDTSGRSTHEQGPTRGRAQCRAGQGDGWKGARENLN